MESNPITSKPDTSSFTSIAYQDVAGSRCGFPANIFYDKYNYTENPKYAPQRVILNRCSIVDNTWGAMWRAVNDSYVINCAFANKKIDMGLLKCDVTMENSTFDKGNEIYTDVKQWPSDVKILW